MKLPYFEVAAFASRPFSGNPAGVCPLDTWPDDSVLQAIAAENNLSETAFFCPRDGQYDLRWFTPEVEIDLCGHATLASAFILYSELGFRGDSIRFRSRGGVLTVTQNSGLFTLDFPSRPPAPCPRPDDLIEALGTEPLAVFKSRDHLAVFASEADVRSLRPDFAALREVETHAVIATAAGTDCDFVSRFFAPAAGINEDPVTGSAHCTLIPYWSERLHKTELFARQVSRRGGELFCRQAGDRVLIGGKAVLYLRGEITVAAGTAGL